MHYFTQEGGCYSPLLRPLEGLLSFATLSPLPLRYSQGLKDPDRGEGEAFICGFFKMKV